MKKIYFAALAMALTACVSNEDLNPVDNYGYIDVNVSNDPIVETKATLTGTAAIQSHWIIKVNETEYTGNTQAFTPGQYTISAQTHNDVNEAIGSDIPWGEAFYSGKKENKQINAGNNTVTIDCGPAKNARLSVAFTDNFKAVFKNYSLNIRTPRSISYDGSDDKPSYFIAQSEIKFTIQYDYGTSTAIETEEQTIRLGDAGTEKVLTVTSNTDGNIQVTIKTSEFTPSTGTTITFDAADGEVESVTDTPNAQQ